MKADAPSPASPCREPSGSDRSATRTPAPPRRRSSWPRWLWRPPGQRRGRTVSSPSGRLRHRLSPTVALDKRSPRLPTAIDADCPLALSHGADFRQVCLAPAMDCMAHLRHTCEAYSRRPSYPSPARRAATEASSSTTDVLTGDDPLRPRAASPPSTSRTSNGPRRPPRVTRRAGAPARRRTSATPRPSAAPW